MPSRMKEIHNGKEIEVWVAANGELLTSAQRFENKRNRKTARGEELHGPFGGTPSQFAADQSAKIKEQDQRIAKLEAAIAELTKSKEGA